MQLLTTRARRKALAPRRAPYWVTLGTGLALGYRKLHADQPGVWVARTKHGAVYREKALGTADDAVQADDNTVLAYAAALKRAQAHAAGDAVATTALTVGEAAEAYIRRLGNEGRTRAAIETTVLRERAKGLWDKPLRGLAEADLKAWMADLLKAGMSAARADRIRTMLRAAINDAPALEQPPAAVLRKGLKMQDAGSNARRAVLTKEQVRSFLSSAYEVDADLGLLLHALAETGHRIDQVRRCEVGDLDAQGGRLLVPVSKKGRGRKARAHIPCPVTDDLIARLQAAVHGRGTHAPLFTRIAKEMRHGSDLGWIEVGRREWRHADHHRGVVEAVQRAGLPDGSTTYSLRHSKAVALLMAGLPVQAVASQLDTSAAIISSHYGRWISDAVSETALRAALPTGPAVT